MILTGIGDAQQLSGAVVSSNFFRALGRDPALGHGFLPAEEKPGTHAVILSYGLWQSTFGGSREVAGKSMEPLPKKGQIFPGKCARGSRYGRGGC
jgi:hypothetical protein